MSNHSSGSMSSNTGVDLTHGVDGWTGSLDAASNATPIAWVPGPGEAYAGATFYNRSATHTLKVSLNFSTPAISPGATELSVPPLGVASVSFDSDVIVGGFFQYVDLPTVGTIQNVSAAVAAVALAGRHDFSWNTINA